MEQINCISIAVCLLVWQMEARNIYISQPLLTPIITHGWLLVNPQNTAIVYLILSIQRCIQSFNLATLRIRTYRLLWSSESPACRFLLNYVNIYMFSLYNEYYVPSPLPEQSNGHEVSNFHLERNNKTKRVHKMSSLKLNYIDEFLFQPELKINAKKMTLLCHFIYYSVVFQILNRKVWYTHALWKVPCTGYARYHYIWKTELVATLSATET